MDVGPPEVGLTVEAGVSDGWLSQRRAAEFDGRDLIEPDISVGYRVRQNSISLYVDVPLHKAREGPGGGHMIQLILTVYGAVCAVATIAFIALSLASKAIELDSLAEEVVRESAPDFDLRPPD